MFLLVSRHVYLSSTKNTLPIVALRRTVWEAPQGRDKRSSNRSQHNNACDSP